MNPTAQSRSESVLHSVREPPHVGQRQLVVSDRQQENRAKMKFVWPDTCTNRRADSDGGTDTSVRTFGRSLLEWALNHKHDQQHQQYPMSVLRLSASQKLCYKALRDAPRSSGECCMERSVSSVSLPISVGMDPEEQEKATSRFKTAAVLLNGFFLRTDQ